MAEKMNICLSAYSTGLTWDEIYRKNYTEAEELLLVRFRGKFVGTFEAPKEDGEAEFFTIQDKLGRKAYENSAIFLFYAALEDVIHRRGEYQDILPYDLAYVEFSSGNGLFIRLHPSIQLTSQLVDELKAGMQRLRENDLHVERIKPDHEDVAAIFEDQGMHDRKRLHRYRRNWPGYLYRLGEIWDYYSAQIVPDLKKIELVDLELYKEGIILLIPSAKESRKVQEFKPAEKIFDRLMADTFWARDLNISDVGAINESIVTGRATELILMVEAMMEKNIGDIAEKIAEQGGVKMVMIAGPSSSGKTSFSYRLSSQLRAKGLRPNPIAVDDYFKNRSETPRDEQGNYNFECLEAIDVEQFNTDMLDLLAGKTVILPRFNFKTGMRETGQELTLQDGDILVIEGIHGLNDALTYKLPKDAKFKIYISALTQLNIDAHNRIHTTDARLLRRMVRDAATRGISAEQTIRMWPSVRRGEDEYIFPFQESADVVFNSALIYELSILKPYAQNLLYGIPKSSGEYDEAMRLLEFLDHFLVIPSENVMHNSILREFIGGSIFTV